MKCNTYGFSKFTSCRTISSLPQVACLDELRRCIEMHGVSILGKKGLHQVSHERHFDIIDKKVCFRIYLR